VTLQKIQNLEKEMDFIKDALTSHAQTIKECQTYLIKLAHNQAQVTKRISQWPYIAVPLDAPNREDGESL
jgi:hypothetical protein